jgi:hypothetical protein
VLDWSDANITAAADPAAYSPRREFEAALSGARWRTLSPSMRPRWIELSALAAPFAPL